MNKLIITVLSLIVAQFSGQALAQSTLAKLAGEENTLRLQMSPFSFHWGPRDPEDRHVFLVGLEREHPNGKIDGVAYFSNTFGQESVYLFPWGGVYKNIYGIPKLNFKWTLGVIYGYKPPFEDKVPFNYKGFAPAVIPAISYDFSPNWSGQINLLGTQGVMFQINAPLK